MTISVAAYIVDHVSFKKPSSPLLPSSTETPPKEPCFGLRIESHVVQAAIATPMDDGRFFLTFDQVVCQNKSGWLTASGAEELERAVEVLVDRQQMRRRRVAVSLAGDFCVTRVTMGTPEQLDHDLQMLAGRIPRYLQLGPGEKVTGSTRQKVDSGVEHAVTGVVNRSLIQIVYDALRVVDIDLTWVEPSLVSVARLTEKDPTFDDRPILIADGMGKQWDVGIACMGRLLLDYRPAAANNNENFCNVLQGHCERLKRFCARHRGIATGELNDLLIFGEEAKLQEVLDRLKDSSRLSPKQLCVPDISDLYHVDSADRAARNVPAVATVYPLLVGIGPSEVADLLDHVRRAPDLSAGQRLLRIYWPVAVAAICLFISYGLVSSERRRQAGTGSGRAELQAEMIATSVKQTRISRNQNELDHLRRVEAIASEHRWDHLFVWITKMMPPSMKLKEFRVDSGSVILMEGSALDETIIYEWVNSLRHLPKVSQVALKGTTPNTEDQSTGFTVQLKTQPTVLFQRAQRPRALEGDR